MIKHAIMHTIYQIKPMHTAILDQIRSIYENENVFKAILVCHNAYDALVLYKLLADEEYPVCMANCQENVQRFVQGFERIIITSSVDEPESIWDDRDVSHEFYIQDDGTLFAQRHREYI
jgi:hypothetical protein